MKKYRVQLDYIHVYEFDEIEAEHEDGALGKARHEAGQRQPDNSYLSDWDVELIEEDSL